MLTGKSKELNKKGRMDITFLGIVLVLLSIGLIMMYSASYAWAINDGLSANQYFVRQCAMAAIGIVAMIIASRVDYHVYSAKLFNALLIFGSWGAMLLCFTGLSSDNEDARRWITVFGVSIQPSEFMKVALIFSLAYIFASNHYLITQKYHFWYPIVFPAGAAVFISAVLLYEQRHISGLLIVGLISLVIFLISGMRRSYAIAIIILAIIAAICIYLYFTLFSGYSYLQTRLEVFQNPLDDSLFENDENWQIKNSLIAVGSGGWFGLGFGNSRQKFLYLPESKNDFIFAVVVEELGFIGAMLIILLFFALVLRGFKIANRAPDKFGMIVAAALTFHIGLQALLNIAVVTNAMPNTGISLPFFSYGGSALITQLAEMGVVLNISKQRIIETEEDKENSGGSTDTSSPPTQTPVKATVRKRRRTQHHA